MLFIDASDQIARGKAQNLLEPEHVNQILDWFKACVYGDVENYVSSFSKDLKENDYNLNIPLYVEKLLKTISSVKKH